VNYKDKSSGIEISVTDMDWQNIAALTATQSAPLVQSPPGQKWMLGNVH
jgi:hypothetical protein